MYGTSKDSHISGFPKVSMSILRLSVVEAAGLAGLPGSVLSSGSGVRASLLHAGTSRQHNITSGSERECRHILFKCVMFHINISNIFLERFNARL